MKIVTSVISIAIIITDISQMKSRILCLSIVQPLRCDLFERLDIDRLAEDTLFLPDFIVSENHCDVSGFRFNLAGETRFQFTSESTDQIERNKVAVHVFSLVDCVCHVTSISKSSTELQARLEQFRNDSEDCEKYCLSHDNESDDVCDSFESVHFVSFVVCVCCLCIISSTHPKIKSKIRDFQKILKSISLKYNPELLVYVGFALDFAEYPGGCKHNELTHF